MVSSSVGRPLLLLSSASVMEMQSQVQPSCFIKRPKKFEMQCLGCCTYKVNALESHLPVDIATWVLGTIMSSYYEGH